jgi:diadenylate cyclase
MDVIDVLVVAFLIYELISLIRNSSGARVAKAIILLLVVLAFTSMAHMYALNFVLNYIVQIGGIALIIVFQPELRRFLEKVGKMSNLRDLFTDRSHDDGMEKVIAQTVDACEIMSREKTGVLIVFERTIPLDEYFRSGTILDAQVSAELLRNLFFPKASLHDGAVIIRGGRIAAAGCVLPLSDNVHLSRDLGTRHRAGIGISEETDAVTVIVSEETGTISVAIGGMLKRYLAPETLERLLINELIPQNEENPAPKVVKSLKQWLPKKKEDKDAE